MRPSVRACVRASVHAPERPFVRASVRMCVRESRRPGVLASAHTSMRAYVRACVRYYLTLTTSLLLPHCYYFTFTTSLLLPHCYYLTVKKYIPWCYYYSIFPRMWYNLCISAFMYISYCEVNNTYSLFPIENITHVYTILFIGLFMTCRLRVYSIYKTSS